MGEVGPEEFLVMGVEVDDRDPPAGRERAGGLLQRPGGIVEEVQHLMDDDEVVAVALDRRGVDVALAQLDVAEAGLVDAAPGEREHRRALVDADGADGPRREQLQHAPGARCRDRAGCGTASRRSSRRAPPRPAPRARAGRGSGPSRRRCSAK